VFLRIADDTGIDPAPFLAVLELKRDGRRRSASDWRTLTDAYLTQLGRLIHAVDGLAEGSTRA
jgi:hypothetical protein